MPTRGGTTSCLLSHLKHNHDVAHADVEKRMRKRSCSVESENSIVNSLMKKQKYNRQSQRWKHLTTSVIKFIARDGLPIYSVTKNGLQEMLSAFDPKYEYVAGM